MDRPLLPAGARLRPLERALSFAAPSDWLERWAHLLAPASSVLDLACGHGRHTHWLARAGHSVTALDRDPALLAPLAGLARTVEADLEGAPWPLPGERFDAVLVTNYLWRPLFADLLDAVRPGGWLIYETFAQAHAALGRPRRPEFLLRPGELLDLVRAPSAPAPAWQVVAFEEGRLDAHGAVPEREVQRIVARRGDSASGRPDLLLPPG